MNEKKRILIVENEMLIAMYLKSQLEMAGWEVVGPVGNLRQGLELAHSENFSIALLDINLGPGSSSLEIANILARKGIPFIFVSGYSEVALPQNFMDSPILAKPIDLQKLMQTLQDTLSPRFS